MFERNTLSAAPDINNKGDKYMSNSRNSNTNLEYAHDNANPDTEDQFQLTINQPQQITSRYSQRKSNPILIAKDKEGNIVKKDIYDDAGNLTHQDVWVEYDKDYHHSYVEKTKVQIQSNKSQNKLVQGEKGNLITVKQKSQNKWLKEGNPILIAKDEEGNIVKKDIYDDVGNLTHQDVWVEYDKDHHHSYVEKTKAQIYNNKFSSKLIKGYNDNLIKTSKKYHDKLVENENGSPIKTSRKSQNRLVKGDNDNPIKANQKSQNRWVKDKDGNPIKASQKSQNRWVKDKDGKLVKALSIYQKNQRLKNTALGGALEKLFQENEPDAAREKFFQENPVTSVEEFNRMFFEEDRVEFNSSHYFAPTTTTTTTSTHDLNQVPENDFLTMQLFGESSFYAPPTACSAIQPWEQSFHHLISDNVEPTSYVGQSFGNPFVSNHPQESFLNQNDYHQPSKRLRSGDHSSPSLVNPDNNPSMDFGLYNPFEVERTNQAPYAYAGSFFPSQSSLSLAQTVQAQPAQAYNSFVRPINNVPYLPYLFNRFPENTQGETSIPFSNPDEFPYSVSNHPNLSRAERGLPNIESSPFISSPSHYLPNPPSLEAPQQNQVTPTREINNNNNPSGFNSSLSLFSPNQNRQPHSQYPFNPANKEGGRGDLTNSKQVLSKI
jgi:hypothetical protein